MHAHCASGCCGSHAAWPCPCPAGGSDRLADAVALTACYLHTQGGLAAEQAYYATLDTPATALREALLALADDAGLRPGPVPLPESTVNRLITALAPLAETLAACSDFADLHAQLLQVGQEHGLEPTAAYDTALRFGMHTGLTPAFIYCHAGNAEAVRAIGLEPPAAGWLDPHSLPAPIRALEPSAAEHCLSLCRNQWQRLALKSAKENL